MGRVTEALLGNRGFARGATNPILDPMYGGQMGFGPDLREWVSNAAYIQRNLIPVLFEAPRFFQLLPDGAKLVEILKAMVELHPKTIEGLNSSLTVETGETPVGGAGEVQEEITNVTRARSQPVFGYSHDKYGRPFQKFLEFWITNGLMDPATKIANIGTLATGWPSDMLPDQYAMTMMFIEPDPVHRKVMKSWLCTNMFPKGTGDITGRRDLTSALPINELSIEFTAITQVGLGVDILAQRVLDVYNITNANPNQRAAFIQQVNADVVAGRKGYREQVAEFGATAIPLP